MEGLRSIHTIIVDGIIVAENNLAVVIHIITAANAGKSMPK